MFCQFGRTKLFITMKYIRRISLLLVGILFLSLKLQAQTACFTIASPGTAYNQTHQCVPFQVTLNDCSTGSYDHAMWTLLVATNSSCSGPFGTWQVVGPLAPGTPATMNINATGVYNVRLDLYDASNNLIATTTQNCLFQIFPKPSISATASPNPLCGGGAVNFTPNVSGGTAASGSCGWTYQWNFGGGNPSTFNGLNPPPVYYSCRTAPYSVVFIATDCNGCNDVFVNPSAVTAPCKPNASYLITAGSTCSAPANLTFAASPVGPNYSYGWWFPSTLPTTGAATQTGVSINHNFPALGCYNIQMAVKDNSTGCADTVTTPNAICIDGFSVTSMTTNQTSICSGQSVCCTLHIVTTSGATMSTAFFSGTATPTTAGIPTTATFNYIGNGDYVGCFNLGASAATLTYTISIGTITNTLNNCTITYPGTKSVTVKPAPVAQINMQAPYVDNYCAPSHQFCFTASQPGVNAGASYDWYLTAGYNPSVGTSPNSYCTTYNGVGMHNIYLKVCINSAAGLCCSFDMDTVYLQKPNFNFVGDTLNTCAPFNTHFIASPYSASSDSIYKWYPTGFPAPPGAGPFITTTNTFTYTYNSPIDTCYSVTCILVKKAAGSPAYACTDTITKLKYVKVGHKVTPVVTISPNNVCLVKKSACVQLNTLVPGYSLPIPANKCPTPLCDWYFTRPGSKAAVLHNYNCDSPKVCFSDTGYYNAHYRVCIGNCCDTVHVDSAIVVSGIIGDFIDSTHCTSAGTLNTGNPTVTFKTKYKIFPRPTSGKVYTQLVINGVPNPVTGVSPYIIYDSLDYGTPGNPLTPSFKRYTVNAFPQTGSYNICYIVSYPQSGCPPDTTCKTIQLVPLTAVIRLVGANRSTWNQCKAATWTFSSAGCSPQNPAVVQWIFSDSPNVIHTYANPADTSIVHVFKDCGYVWAKLRISNASGSCKDSAIISGLQVVDFSPIFTLKPVSSSCNTCFWLINKSTYCNTGFDSVSINWNLYKPGGEMMYLSNDFDSVYYCVNNVPYGGSSSVVVNMYDTVAHCFKTQQYYYFASGVVADFTMSTDTVVCSGANVSFFSTTKGTPDPSKYVWNVNSGPCTGPKTGTQAANSNPNFASGVSSISNTFTSQGYYNVTLYAKNPTGSCFDSICKTIHVQDPVACFTWKRDTLTCPGLDTLYNCSYGAGDSLIVTFHTNNAAGSGLPFTYTASYSKPFPKKIIIPAKLPGVYDVCMELRNNAVGCMDSMCRTLTVMGPIGYVTSIQNRVVCAGDPSSICWYTNSFTRPNVIYCDSLPISVPYSSTNSYCITHAFKNAGFCKNQIWIQDSAGCSYPLTDTVIVDKPNGGFRWTINGRPGVNGAYCGPITVAFADTSKKTVYNLDPLSYHWTFYHANGTVISTSTQVNPSVVFFPPDTISAQLIMASMYGCKDTVYTKDIARLYSFPVAAFQSSADTICRNACVTFTNTSLNLDPVQLYTWHYNWPSLNPVDHNTNGYQCYNTAGNFTAVLIDSSVNGCVDTSATRVVTALPDLVAAFTIANDTLCGATATAIFNDASTPTSGLSYCWNFGDLYDANGNLDPHTCQSTLINPTHAYTLNPPNGAGNQFNVKLIVTSRYGCMDSIAHNVWLFANPVAQLSSSPLVACDPMKTNFVDLSSSINPVANYHLVYGDGKPDYNSPNAIGGVSGQHTYSPAGTYTASYTVTTIQGCSTSTTLNFTVNPNPVACAGNQDTICAGDVIALGCMPVPNIQYNWFSPGGPIYTPNNTIAQPTVHPFLSTTYQLAVVNQFGCSDTDDVFIYVWPLVSVTAGPDSNICYGQPITLWANNVGPIIGPFQWHSSHYDVVANTQMLTVSPLHTDLYTVAVNGPCNSDSTSVQVNVYMPPPVTLEPSATIVAGQPYSILSVGNGNANWYPNYMITCTDCTNPTVSPEVNTTYHVILTDIHGCIDSAKITVTVLCDRTNAVYVPNAFTPSKPGLNDHFYIQGTGVKEVNYLRIYNRWGNLVFSNEHFQINQKDLGWDGRFGGHELSSDVFMYQMQVECANGNIFPISGNFTLIR